MHYYRFNIGNYRKKTVHLTLIEHAIYRSLLDTYYMTENPLDPDIAKLMRSHSVRTAEEKEAFQNVIDEFFVLTDQGFTHEECEKQLKAVYEKSEKARESAKARWAKRECEKDPNAMQSQSERMENECERKENGCEQDADGMLPSTYIPSTNNNPSSKPKAKSKFESCDMEFAEWAYSTLLQFKPDIKKPNFDSWANSVRLMREIDGRTLEGMTRVWSWARQDSFWKSNILSISKFREKYDQLDAKAQNPTQGGYQTAHEQRAQRSQEILDGFEKGEW